MGGGKAVGKQTNQQTPNQPINQKKPHPSVVSLSEPSPHK